MRLSGQARFPDEYGQGHGGQMVYAVSPSLNPISLQVEENMTVFEGEIAHLNCKAQNLAEFTVSMTNQRLLQYRIVYNTSGAPKGRSLGI